ncbi:hypothetical protein C8R44DRAFT_870797 [Mycena epipterygia]|nr:hypothetical protein C8R44DRAFT_870797 [Mycena epipterygia]
MESQVQIWSATSTNANQQWIASPVTFLTSFTFALKTDPTLCVAASANAANASLVIEPCSSGPAAQAWIAPSNDKIVFFDDLCITLTHGTKIASLGGIAELQECLDLTHGIKTPGNPLQIWSCNETDNTNQDWIDIGHF